jgi:DNA-directed RNA polymerase subunit RPC12/RpoP
MSTEEPKARDEDAMVTTTDILFECPSCGKSLVVDEAGEGMIIDCPQCRTNVIVPPQSTKVAAPPTALKVESKPIAEGKSAAANVPHVLPEKRLAALAGRLKEIQAQRTEVTSRIAARLNDVNRDLVMLARLETSQQQILSEWNQLVERISAAPMADEVDASRPAVVGASVGKGARTRISFGQ